VAEEITQERIGSRPLDEASQRCPGNTAEEHRHDQGPGSPQPLLGVVARNGFADLGDHLGLIGFGRGLTHQDHG
jgi:hypothetical protein